MLMVSMPSAKPVQLALCLLCNTLGLQVLIFSQFKIMMDVLEDSLRLRKYPVERIDGSVSGRDRQAAIDRYSKGAHLLLFICCSSELW